ncbi:aminotransferase class I/II-fold pyridoxal phosphate-dependent enzyme [Halobacillus sp. Nhm2S1]|uniref:aminotransferase class I/II-fold pyridoxal phosphate-dependent enzyme n=1 Tax=Halobacillus sp. Nhm2S1 TaxID=2866716 RepID=UPI001C729EEE|nr:aminotransferase class I/II-fold pyridoxal phosphate-dependent enzyme [Halobacillus sp. Nhm2S1]MBX0359888.1 aminotransferase class I/II-fold pyridoxal phosphate-dependent enzyme [Halobacillus sp. Nhm2S1]
MNPTYMPLYEALKRNIERDPVSFHVPGHKYGTVFNKQAYETYQSILQLDATEVEGLDDLHAPEGVIEEAQHMASDFFNSDHTFFLVNGTTVGNMAMILSVCHPWDEIIVQRNCHKSVLNALELSGASPVLISPRYERKTGRHSQVSVEDVEQALKNHPDSKAVFLTYPDYFGRTYDLEKIVEVVHSYRIPLLVDEAHGVHFQLGKPFPVAALTAGADGVAQSAHKMAPAMTMTSFLHVQGDRIDLTRVRHYLQMLQSSSPSYPLMASLDVARAYLASWNSSDKKELFSFLEQVKSLFSSYDYWDVKTTNDPLKLTLEVRGGTGFEWADALDAVGIVPELATTNQILLVFGLAPSMDLMLLKERLNTLDSQLKKHTNRATIIEDQIHFPAVQKLEYSYSFMQRMDVVRVDWQEAAGCVAAEAIIPYPPGIPLVMKGERLDEEQIAQVHSLVSQGARFQNTGMEQGVLVFKGE